MHLYLVYLLITDISDHLPIFYITKSKIKKITSKFNTVTTRCVNEDNIYNLKTELEQVDWSQIYSLTNIDLAYKLFHDTIVKSLNKHIPIETKKVKAYSNVHKPWITSAISKSIRRKNNLYKNYFTKTKCCQ